MKENFPEKSRRSDIDRFLDKIAHTRDLKPAGRNGRLIFAMDATASREPTWDRACGIQAEMFQTTTKQGGLDIQLCYYRGLNDFFASSWINNPNDLLAQMTRVHCVGGHTQIARLLSHAIQETKTKKVNAVVFVGDCVEENIDHLCGLAGKLSILGVPVFMFQEGYEPLAEAAFRRIAETTQGAYCRFDANSAQQLKDLLSAVAVYAASGKTALEHFSQSRGGVVKLLSQQLDKKHR